MPLGGAYHRGVGTGKIAHSAPGRAGILPLAAARAGHHPRRDIQAGPSVHSARNVAGGACPSYRMDRQVMGRCGAESTRTLDRADRRKQTDLVNNTVSN
jgi:hypothetical protein